MGSALPKDIKTGVLQLNSMHNDVLEILATEEEIRNIVKRLGKQICEEYHDRNPLILCILKGSLIFTADIVRQFDFPCTIDFMQVSSYGSGSETTGKLKIKKVTF